MNRGLDILAPAISFFSATPSCRPSYLGRLPRAPSLASSTDSTSSTSSALVQAASISLLRIIIQPSLVCTAKPTSHFSSLTHHHHNPRRHSTLHLRPLSGPPPCFLAGISSPLSRLQILSLAILDPPSLCPTRPSDTIRGQHCWLPRPRPPRLSPSSAPPCQLTIHRRVAPGAYHNPTSDRRLRPPPRPPRQGHIGIPSVLSLFHVRVCAGRPRSCVRPASRAPSHPPRWVPPPSTTRPPRPAPTAIASPRLTTGDAPRPVTTPLLSCAPATRCPSTSFTLGPATPRSGPLSLPYQVRNRQTIGQDTAYAPHPGRPTTEAEEDQHSRPGR